MSDLIWLIFAGGTGITVWDQVRKKYFWFCLDGLSFLHGSSLMETDFDDAIRFDEGLKSLIAVIITSLDI